ncbi:hypothetical protein [Actinosynnema sp. NPDC020468]|uniref:hypothetical protein n=1 Tax=Actinosynnema sp. NPDC020468 TaxID=3154488 RepID=UPI003403E634
MAELIRKQPAPLRIASREETERHRFVADLLGDPEPTGPPSRRTARIAGLSTGALVFVATVLAAALLAGHRDPGPAHPHVSPPAEISGSEALRPDLLWAELGGSVDVLPASVTPLAADSADVVPPDALATGPRPQVDVVRRFYELLPAKPAAAARLLAGELVGGQGDFATAWSAIQSITIESTTLQPDGTVRAAVSMQERSGQWLRVEQVFWLTDTRTPRIIGTRVLSAQRS